MLGRRSNSGGYLHHCITIHRVSIWTAVVFGKARRVGAHQQLRVVWVSDRSPMRYDEEVSQRGDKRLFYQFTDGIALEICSFDMLGLLDMRRIARNGRVSKQERFRDGSLRGHKSETANPSKKCVQVSSFNINTAKKKQHQPLAAFPLNYCDTSGCLYRRRPGVSWQSRHSRRPLSRLSGVTARTPGLERKTRPTSSWSNATRC